MTFEAFVTLYAGQLTMRRGGAVSKREARDDLLNLFGLIESVLLRPQHLGVPVGAPRLVRIPGFGQFKLQHRKSRTVKLPVFDLDRSGHVMVEKVLPASMRVVFTPARALTGEAVEMPAAVEKVG
jgi:nucleoid DNA-binding protein